MLLSLFLLPLPRMWADIYSGEVMEYVNKEKGLYGETVSKIMADTDGRIWIATNDGVCLYNGMKITRFPFPAAARGTTIHTTLPYTEARPYTPLRGKACSG